MRERVFVCDLGQISGGVSRDRRTDLTRGRRSGLSPLSLFARSRRHAQQRQARIPAVDRRAIDLSENDVVGAVCSFLQLHGGAF